jgi:PD-(D/E)XK endonuclease
VRERLINRRQQGDLGEASAIEWLTSVGATVSIPFGHSPDYDIVAEVDARLLRVQVKTSTAIVRTPSGDGRYAVQIATNGGNRSWSGVSRKFDASRFDVLFALVGDGRRWLIPAAGIEAETSITVGGPKYAEFEIEAAPPIHHLVHGYGSPALESDAAWGSAGVGEPGRSVKSVPKLLSGFDSHLPHSPRSSAPSESRRRRFEPSRYERLPGKRCEAVINQKRRLTLPQQALLAAGLRDGDRVHARAEGPGRIVLEKVGLPVWAEPP